MSENILKNIRILSTEFLAILICIYKIQTETFGDLFFSKHHPLHHPKAILLRKIQFHWVVSNVVWIMLFIIFWLLCNHSNHKHWSSGDHLYLRPTGVIYNCKIANQNPYILAFDWRPSSDIDEVAAVQIFYLLTGISKYWWITRKHHQSHFKMPTVENGAK